MDIVLLGIIVGGAGGAFSSILGWLDGEEPFIPRKFTNGVIRGIVGGVLLSLGFNLTSQDSKEIVLLFLSALGFDVGVYRGYKIIGAKV